MKARHLLLAAAVMMVAPLSVEAQSRDVINSVEVVHNNAKNFLMATAENASEDLYSYRPTEEVRTFGGILAHIANAQFFICSTAIGEDNPSTENFEQTRSTKAEISEALEASFEYCEGVFAQLDDEKGAEPRQMFGSDVTVTGVMSFNLGHNFEHYGNLVTYMRMNGIVPPSSGGQ